MTMVRMRTATLIATTLAVLVRPHAFTVAAQQPSTEYQLIRNPLKFPEGRGVGFIMGLDVDRNGKDIWVLDTCGGDLGACVTSKVDPILKFDASGTLLKSFGSGMLAQPHGLYIDRSGYIWIVDGFGANEKQTVKKGHQVFKFTQDGKLLMTLGTAGVTGETETTFNMPSDVLVAPNGDIFVADGHADKSNARIVKFTKDGKFIKAWGTSGAGPGQFSETHSLAMDSRGRLFVGDRRNNHRIQIFDQDGKFLEEWKQFGSPAEIYIDRHDVMYVADALSGLGGMNPGKKPGIYIGSAKDGHVTTFIPDIEPNRMQELVVADTAGNIWTGCTVGREVRKWVKK
jgi:streptogramin lyase